MGGGVVYLMRMSWKYFMVHMLLAADMQIMVKILPVVVLLNIAFS